MNTDSIVDNFFGSSTEPLETGKIEEHTETIDPPKPEEEIIVGIDLGTTNSSVAIWRNNNLEVIPDEMGNLSIPSIVAFTSVSRYVGYSAKNQIELNPKNVIYEIKRLIGRKRNDISIENDKQFLSYELSEDKNGNVLIECEINHNTYKYTPEEISAMILMKLKQTASDYLKRDVKKAVITVPAYFNDAQREATRDAATIAGLECVRIINEPTSAALAYGLNIQSHFTKKEEKKEELTVIIYDLGGGTLDTSLLTINDGIFEVHASVGNTHLGGADFDNRLVNYCISQFKKKNNISKLEKLSALSLQRLKKSCENAKKILSTTTKAIIAVKDFYDNIDLFINITVEKFTEICRDLFIICLKPLEDILKSCGKERDEIDEIILVGGMTRVPLIRENIKKFFGGKEPNISMNPDEVVAAGAAIQGYILSHHSDPFAEYVTLLDVIPLSLGVEVLGGVMNVIIDRNTIIPVTKKRKYTTDSDYETSVLIKIFEGERSMTKDNFLVGQFELTGLEPAPRGSAKIEVTFSIDVNGIITVTAIDLDRPVNKNSIIIKDNKGRISREEIKKLVESAQQLELRDRLEKEKKQYYYEIEDLCSNIRININNDDFKLKEQDKLLILDDITKIEQWLKEKNYYERHEDEYKDIKERLKKRYGTLILKYSHDNTDQVKATEADTKATATTVYEDEHNEDEEKVFEKIAEEEIGISNEMDENEKKELKELRNTLIDLCHNIFEVLNDQSLKLNEDHVKELKNFIDDTLLWIYVQPNISRIDYRSKIDDINNTCNKLIQEAEKENKKIFDENIIQQNIKTSRDELEQLCFALKSGIASNIFSLHEEQIKTLDQKIDTTLNWLIAVELKKEDVQNNVYVEKIKEINDICDNLYQSMLSINIDRKINIFEQSRNDFILSDNMDGTSIANLKK